jgi:hypothetical protein
MYILHSIHYYFSFCKTGSFTTILTSIKLVVIFNNLKKNHFQFLNQSIKYKIFQTLKYLIGQHKNQHVSLKVMKLSTKHQVLQFNTKDEVLKYLNGQH